MEPNSIEDFSGMCINIERSIEDQRILDKYLPFTKIVRQSIENRDWYDLCKFMEIAPAHRQEVTRTIQEAYRTIINERNDSEDFWTGSCHNSPISLDGLIEVSKKTGVKTTKDVTTNLRLSALRNGHPYYFLDSEISNLGPLEEHINLPMGDHEALFAYCISSGLSSGSSFSSLEKAIGITGKPSEGILLNIAEGIVLDMVAKLVDRSDEKQSRYGLVAIQLEKLKRLTATYQKYFGIDLLLQISEESINNLLETFDRESQEEDSPRYLGELLNFLGQRSPQDRVERSAIHYATKRDFGGLQGLLESTQRNVEFPENVVQEICDGPGYVFEESQPRRYGPERCNLISLIHFYRRRNKELPAVVVNRVHSLYSETTQLIDQGYNLFDSLAKLAEETRIPPPQEIQRKISERYSKLKSKCL